MLLWGLCCTCECDRLCFYALEQLAGTPDLCWYLAWYWLLLICTAAWYWLLLNGDMHCGHEHAMLMLGMGCVVIQVAQLHKQPIGRKALH